MHGNAGMIRHKLTPQKACFSLSQNGSLGAVLLLVFAASAHAMPRRGMVEFQTSRDSFCVVGPDHISPIYIDTGDFPGVIRAANDLAQDIGRVSGKTVTVVSSTDKLSLPPILIGTLGKAAVIDEL